MSIRSREYLIHNWESVLNDFDAIAPEDREKRKIIAGCEALRDDEYLRFFARLHARYQEQKISLNVVEKAIFPSQAKPGFFSTNWQNHTVRALMEEVRSRTPAGSRVNGYADDVLSGKAKREYEKYCEQVGMKPRQPVEQSSQGEFANLEASAQRSLSRPDTARARPQPEGRPPNQSFPIGLAVILVAISATVVVIARRWLKS